MRNDTEFFRPYLPDREPTPQDYNGYNRIEVVHFPIDTDQKGNPREELVRSRLHMLREAGLEIQEVDIDTDSGDLKGIKVVVAGSLGDVCAAKRRGFVIEHGGKAKIDSALTADY
jgi:hypothetical protein